MDFDFDFFFNWRVLKDCLQVGGRRRVPLPTHLAGSSESALISRVHKVKSQAHQLHR